MPAKASHKLLARGHYTRGKRLHNSVSRIYGKIVRTILKRAARAALKEAGQ